MENMQPMTQSTMEINKVMTNMTNFQGTFNLTKSGFNPKMPGHHTDHTMILRQPPRTAKRIGAGISLPYVTGINLPVESVPIQHGQVYRFRKGFSGRTKINR